MKPTPSDSFNGLSTDWGEVVAAQGDGPQARAAQRAVLSRYGRAIQRYLQSALRDRHAADDLAQEFALRFVRGDFHRLHPARGRFRDFARTVLHNLVADHYRGQRSAPAPMREGDAPIVEAESHSDAEFMDHWRAALLDRAWQELRRLPSRANGPLYAVLRFRIDRPDQSIPDAAREFSDYIKRPITPGAFRQALHRARVRFAELLRLEVAFSLETSRRELVEQELADLKLLAYCRPRASRSKATG
jgi:RNA polymerase sigma-70 factor (ECF subfamily)